MIEPLKIKGNAALATRALRECKGICEICHKPLKFTTEMDAD